MHAPVVLKPAALEAHAVVAARRAFGREMHAVANAEVELAVLEVAAARAGAVHRVERDSTTAEHEVFGLKVRAVLQRQRASIGTSARIDAPCPSRRTDTLSSTIGAVTAYRARGVRCSVLPVVAASLRASWSDWKSSA